ncbi:nickel pincer cofactor biosynthesis protein LarC [Saccharothrix luteola]|uniref:nickel pincer cofactor biosynthesis protein LarC n=1 Tax=Saccharothrix luteola TaxID=2893018 RepID=UPI001E393442|nr:nickel pincer cofactor biosynthesis protein LarC [Saccharothrix luteola]MCC8247110.1 nickel pincer cofactor biosynthesis protein LarC [Saccharothrix luteola]MCC8249849.1 nickel pincer cofactor biosynthesis protein LarC [Saccharothrix luteola]
MSKVCLISPFTGLAGDMLLAALVDAGAPPAAIRAAVADTGLTGWDLTVDPVLTHGLTGRRAVVSVSDDATSRKAGELIAMASRVREREVADTAVAALRAIAEVEGRLHGEDPDQVHLHELGGHDTLVDVVGVAAALHALDVRAVHCEALPIGAGSVRTAHGVLPCPAPATSALLRGAKVVGTTLSGETVTPTAAALLLAIGADYGPVPEMRLAATGYGVGTRTLPDRPNVAVVRLGDREAAQVRDLVVLETNLDDVTGEVLGHVVALLLDSGALDSWITPATMKKGRPGHVLHALATPESADGIERRMLVETGSLGVRRTGVRRTALPRTTDTVHVHGMPVRRKHGPHHGKPEYDDAVAVARRTGLPLRTVLALAAESPEEH